MTHDVPVAIASGSRNRLPAKRIGVVATVAILLAVVGWRVDHHARRALQATLARNLDTLLRASEATVGLWRERELQRVETLAERVAAVPRDRLDEELAGVPGSLVVDADGKALAGDRDAATVQEVAAFAETHRSGKPRLARDGQGRPVAMAPVRSGGDVVAVLGLRVDPASLTRLLATGRIGNSGASFVFDADGMALAGLSAPQRLGDPGGDLTAGFEPGTPPPTWPLTRAVAEAQEHGRGRDVDGYRDHRGVTVVGAWTFDRERGIGLATQVDRDEAFAPLRPLQAALYTLFGLLVLTAVGGLAAFFVFARLRKRVRQLGQYTLERKIGEGGMGAVYRASHTLLRRPTAIKLLKPSAIDTESVKRFEREVRLTSTLTHPSTIAIYDYGRTEDGLFYYAMEYLHGIALSQLIALAGPLPPARVVHILKQVCGSLAEAHEAGLLHRDIKPPNIVLCRQGGLHDVAKVLDFGLVKEMDESSLVALTIAGHVAGTPAYIPPERLTGSRAADPSIDVYAVGAVGFNLLTATDVYDATDMAEMAHQVVHGKVPLASERLGRPVPEALETLIADCLAKRPEGRPRSARDLLRRLEAIPGPAWTEDDARAWWERHEDEIEALRRGESVRTAADADTGEFETDRRRF